MPPPPPEIDTVFNPRPVKDNLPIQFTNNYMNMRSSIDPLLFKLARWKRPTSEPKRAIVEAMSNICNPHYIHILCPFIIIELFDDARSYAARFLPRGAGGCSAVYRHQKASIFEDVTMHGVHRTTEPSTNLQYSSGYPQAHNVLTPGTRVSSTPTPNTDQPSTAGILLRNLDGQQRITLSHHAFSHSTSLYSPNPTTSTSVTHIGIIDQRFPYLDIALAKLFNPYISSSSPPPPPPPPPKPPLPPQPISYVPQK